MFRYDRLVRARREIAPLKQGDLDGLCGLYAVINAARIVIHPYRTFHRPHATRLFERGLIVLSGARRIKATMLIGMYDPLWIKLADAVLDEAGYLAGGVIVRTAILVDHAHLDTRDAIRAIRRNLKAGRPVLLTLAGRYRHWTVIVGYGPRTFTLFDSSSYRRILLRSIVLEGPPSHKPHVLKRANVFALEFKPKP